ncbi:MAG: DUF1552 domain-containing protein [Myxococcota bacterium]
MTSKRNHRLTRRSLLGGAAAAAAGLPFLRSLPSAASGSGFPLRIVFWYTPNDWIGRDVWDVGYAPGESGPLPSNLPTPWAPLDPYKERLLMVSDLDMKSRDLETHGAGHIGTGHVLTGRPVTPYGSADNNFYASGQSVDQFIADRLGVDALTLAVRPGAKNGHGRISYRGDSDPVDPQEKPLDAFNSVFSDFTQPPELVDERREQRKSVLDVVAGNLSRVQSGLPAEDKIKLEAHLDAVRSIEEDLDTTVSLQCEGVPPAPPIDNSYGDGGNGKAPQTHRLHTDVMVQALACGVTEVASMQFGGAATQYMSPTWANDAVNPIFNQRDIHNISHDYNTDGDINQSFVDARVELEQWYARQFTYLLDAMEAVDEGGESLLDHSLVVWCKELGQNHAKNRHLYMLAGGACGGLQTDRFVSFPGMPHNNLLVSLCQLMGLDDVTSFGEPSLGSEPLTL